MKHYNVYYREKRTGQYTIWNSATQKLTYTYDLPYQNHNFELSAKKKDISNSGLTLEDYLVQYGHNMRTWMNEFYNCKTLNVKFDWMDETPPTGSTKIVYKTILKNVERFFLLYRTEKGKRHEIPTMEPITVDEHMKFEATYNGALVRLKETGKCKCIGYDFSNSYGNMMSSNLYMYGEQIKFHIPFKAGELNTDTNVPKVFQFGIYKAQVDSDYELFDLIFNRSPDGYYTHYELNFLLKHKKKLEVDIELLGDNLVYSDDKLIDGFKLFNRWNKLLGEIKKELPDNPLVKILRSRLWGTLSQSNTKYYSDAEVDEQKIEFHINPDAPCDYLYLGELEKSNGETIYNLLNKAKPYKHNYRLKSFLVSFQRVQIAEIALKHIEAVHRIHTDNITYDVKRLKKYYNIDVKAGDILHNAEDLPTFIKEEKTTNLFYWHNVNNYERV